MTDSAMRAYLLGQATEDQSARLESLLLESDEADSTRDAIEDDLFDEFARGTLTPEERGRFLERFGGERSRLLVAQALATRSQSRSATGNSRNRQYWMPLAAAAMIAAAVGVGYVRRPTPAPVRSPAATAVPSPVPPIVLAVTLGTSRAAATTPEVVVPSETPLELRVRLDPADTFARYALELHSPSGESIWKMETRAELDPREPILVGTVPANLVAAGTYELAVRGFGGPGSSEDLGFVMVSIRR